MTFIVYNRADKFHQRLYCRFKGIDENSLSF